MRIEVGTKSIEVYFVANLKKVFAWLPFLSNFENAGNNAVAIEPESAIIRVMKLVAALKLPMSKSRAKKESIIVRSWVDAPIKSADM